MRNLNTRRWSTPLTMGAGLFVVITGLLMFFVAERPFKFAHELIGIAFSAAVGLHVLSHWRSFSNYFSQRGAVRVLALAWSRSAPPPHAPVAPPGPPVRPAPRRVPVTAVRNR